MQFLKYFYAGLRISIFNMVNQYRVMYDVAGPKPLINLALFAVPRLVIFYQRRSGKISRRQALTYYTSIEVVQISSWFVTPFMTHEQIQEFIERSFKEAAEYTSKILDELDLDM